MALRRWITPRGGRFTLSQTVLAGILGLAFGAAIGHAVWESPSHQHVWVSFDWLVYRPQDPIRFRIDAPSRRWLVNQGARIGFDQMCMDTARRSRLSPDSLRLMKDMRKLTGHDENGVFTIISDPRKVLHLRSGPHVLCVYRDRILAASTFALEG
jgi:hypothetical protein